MKKLCLLFLPVLLILLLSGCNKDESGGEGWPIYHGDGTVYSTQKEAEAQIDPGKIPDRLHVNVFSDEVAMGWAYASDDKKEIKKFWDMLDAEEWEKVEITEEMALSHHINDMSVNGNDIASFTYEYGDSEEGPLLGEIYYKAKPGTYQKVCDYVVAKYMEETKDIAIDDIDSFIKKYFAAAPVFVSGGIDSYSYDGKGAAKKEFIAAVGDSTSWKAGKVEIDGSDTSPSVGFVNEAHDTLQFRETEEGTDINIIYKDKPFVFKTSEFLYSGLRKVVDKYYKEYFTATPDELISGTISSYPVTASVGDTTLEYDGFKTFTDFLMRDLKRIVGDWPQLVEAPMSELPTESADDCNFYRNDQQYVSFRDAGEYTYIYVMHGMEFLYKIPSAYTAPDPRLADLNTLLSVYNDKNPNDPSHPFSVELSETPPTTLVGALSELITEYSELTGPIIFK